MMLAKDLPSTARLLEEHLSYDQYRYMMFTLPIVMDAHVVIETGFSAGDSTRIWLESLDRLDGDRWLYTYELPWEKKNWEQNELNLRSLGYKTKWEVKWQDSIQGGRDFDKPVDLAYLDSDHTYEQVYNELEAWNHTFHANTVILGDDIWLNDPENHPRLHTRTGGRNPIDPYFAASDWSQKNGWKMVTFTHPNGKFLLYRK